MGKYLIAHDLGTSSNKASLFSTEGKLIGSYTVPYDVHFSEEIVRSRIQRTGGMQFVWRQRKS